MTLLDNWLILIIVEECPKGYPRLAAFLDSDENFMLYRRFGFLQARILLYKQDELRELEEKLDAMDESDAQTKKTAKRLMSRERDDSECEDRKNLIRQITTAFNEYGIVHDFNLILVTDRFCSRTP